MSFQETRALREVLPWTRVDTLLLCASICLIFAVTLYCGHGRILWEDEVLGWLLLHDPSFAHMVHAWKRGADGGGFSFYVTGSLWFRIFGSSPTAFRMYSQTCFAIAFALSWAVLRRFYQPLVVAFASLAVWLVSPALVQHMTEGRFYGLLLASVAWGVWLAFRAVEDGPLSLRLYAAVALANSLMVTSHLLGVVYSAFILFFILWADRAKGVWRPRLYAAASVPWLLLIPQLPAIRASAAVGKPYFWTSQPALTTFAINYTGFTLILALPMALATIWIVARRSTSQALGQTLPGARPRSSAYIFMAVFFLIPPAFFLEGLVAPPLCVSRYLLPMVLATTFYLAELTTLVLPTLPVRLRSSGAATAVAWALFLCILAIYDFGYRPEHTTLQKDYTGTLSSRLPTGVPIICEDAFSFTELISRQHGSGVQYTYLLDWPNSLAAGTPRLEVTQYHLMQQWKEVGYFADAIAYREPFLAANSLFYTLSFEDTVLHGFPASVSQADRAAIIGSQLHQHLADDSRYRVRLFEVVPLGDLTASVWQVCRRESRSCT